MGYPRFPEEAELFADCQLWSFQELQEETAEEAGKYGKLKKRLGDLFRWVKCEIRSMFRSLRDLKRDLTYLRSIKQAM